MKKFIMRLALSLFICIHGAQAAEEKPKENEKPKAAPAEARKSDAPILRDKQLEKAVRKFVFDKRDNDKPLTEEDLANLSTVQGVGLGITDLSGLDKCQNLASLDLSQNQIANLSPLRGLSKLQSLTLTDNRISDIRALGELRNLQYIELSQNQVKSLHPLANLTNLSALYLAHNRVEDLFPLTRLPKLTSLYLDNNRVAELDDINHLKSLSTLSLNNNNVSDLKPLEGLNSLYYLFLENNEIREVEPLAAMVKKDWETTKNFAPFVNIYLVGNPLSPSSKAELEELKKMGVRLHF